jgi:hypothetical protein
MLNRLAHLQNSVQAWLPQARDLSVNEVLQWCRNGASTGDSWTSPRWPQPSSASRACARRAPARATPGHHVAGTRSPPARTGRSSRPAAARRGAKQQARFLERWAEALAGAQAAGANPEPGLADRAQERALGEAAAFAIRIDVAEELSRLGSHLDEIERLLKAGGELGKRLEFLIQELQREANTLGSKSPRWS